MPDGLAIGPDSVVVDLAVLWNLLVDGRTFQTGRLVLAVLWNLLVDGKVLPMRILFMLILVELLRLSKSCFLRLHEKCEGHIALGWPNHRGLWPVHGAC